MSFKMYKKHDVYHSLNVLEIVVLGIVFRWQCGSVKIPFLFSVLVFPARDAAIQKIEAIIRDQFSLEMKNKEHEIEVIGQVKPFCVL